MLLLFIYIARSKLHGKKVTDAKRLKELETKNAPMKKLLAETLMVAYVTKEELLAS